MRSFYTVELYLELMCEEERNKETVADAKNRRETYNLMQHNKSTHNHTHIKMRLEFANSPMQFFELISI